MEQYYKVTKVEIATGRETNYGGGYTMEDVKSICVGYHPSEDFPEMWERANGKYVYFVDTE